mmetsp:Transcript_3597/g.11062  ORF Transcript_3597/g.11062 Transcript_3597/m.11062 type:complete len:210 (-) Transcript_3597:73-702(-)
MLSLSSEALDFRNVFHASSTVLSCALNAASWNRASPASVAIDTARSPFIGVPTITEPLNAGDVVMISLMISKKASKSSIHNASPSRSILFLVQSSSPATKAFARSIIAVSHIRYTLLAVTQALKSATAGTSGGSVPAARFFAISSRSGTRKRAVAHTRFGTQKPICTGPASSSVRCGCVAGAAHTSESSLRCSFLSHRRTCRGTVACGA